MKIVFCGPSLAGESLQSFEGFEFRPPVRQGDLYLAAIENPAAIGVIDGVFEGVPSVWHKEILWALSQGIAVYGGSSMGALRAAELDVYGMVGVGAIYEAYRDGTLEDDDEVALQHGPSEMGYAPLSVPMVNVRATVAAASDAGVLPADAKDALIAAAKSVFFKQRTWDAVFGALAGPAGGESAAWRDWFENNTVDQKKHDALLLLEGMSDPVSGEAIDFEFEHTEMWQQGVASWQRTGRSDEPASDAGPRLVRRETLLNWTESES